VSTPKPKSNAAGPYLGFGLQTVRLCARLLSEPADAKVFVEHDDDVSVHYADGTRLLEQCKSAQKQNPIADWSRDFWKCLHNWLEESSPVDKSLPMSKYRLYVTPSHAGKFVSKLAAASTESDIAAFVAIVMSEVNAAKKSTETYKFAKRFLEATTAEQVGLGTRFQLICEDDPIESIRKLYHLAVAPSLLDDVCAYAIGEAKQQSDALLRAGKAAEINAGVFQAKIRNFVQRTNLPAFLPFSSVPAAEQVHSTLSGRPIFIQQLELIESDREQQIVAVSDYLRASTDKTIWGAQGTLLPDALDAWDDTLIRRHKAIHQSLSILHGNLQPTALGTAIYAECRKLSVQLEAKTVPDHFTHGCLNDLADRRKLGWHPGHESLLKDKGG
jgi:hypothetical protein